MDPFSSKDDDVATGSDILLQPLVSWYRTSGGTKVEQLAPSQRTLLEQLLNDTQTYMPTTTATSNVSYTWIQDETAKKPLIFVHIPKTGGTSINRAANQAGMHWCNRLLKHTLPQNMTPGNVSTCHLPIHLLPLQQNITAMAQTILHELQKLKQQYPTDILSENVQDLAYGLARTVYPYHVPTGMVNPFHARDSFVVIRNPYKRAVSEYYYWADTRNYFVRPTKYNNYIPKKDTALEMNRVIQWRVRLQQEKNYFQQDGHWIPQSDYVYSTVKVNNTNHTIQVRHIQHLVRFEHMNTEVPSLFKAYNVTLQLRHDKDHTKQTRKPQFTVRDLDRMTRQMIERHYERDFELGGYLMIEKTVAEANTANDAAR
jgi:hypothetical protein